ncbi:uncharacterized protein Spt20 [Planococcus citri]|uniref:uncharacterized protein Spt20 n=1 Tax=Planococcus citri TaxID=170843 RepID=UPI0031F7BA61
MNGILKMQNLQAATEEAESLLYKAKKCVPKFCNNLYNGRQSFSIFQKLAEIRKEELSSTFSLADPLVEQNHIKLTDSRLIEKLVIRERLNTLIFNLYPANKGYTLSVVIRNSDNTEKTINSMRLPYTEEQLFSYVDNEEIPPLLCNMIDNCVVHLYYNGCIIAEIRDYRKSAGLTHCIKHYVLLHQSALTIINDVNETITAESKVEDKISAKLELEKTLVLANYGPLCLNPNPSLAIANQKLHYSKYFFNTHKLKFKARKHTLLGIAQKKRQEQLTKCIPPVSNLINFIAKKKAAQVPKLKIPRKLLPECPVSDEFLTEAARTVLELAKPIERPTDTNQSIFNSKLIEEYIIETRDEARLQFMIKLTISQRNADYEYIGEIQQSRELPTGGFHNISYSFPLGTHELATRYVLEFTNVYTERGKIRINFTHKVAGKPAEVFVTSGLRMEGSKLVPIESKSLGLDTLVSWQTFSDSRNDTNKVKSVISVPKARNVEKVQIISQPTNLPNVMKQIGVSSDPMNSNQLQLIRDQQHLQMQIQQQLQHQILQHKRQQNQQLQQEIKAIANFKAQIQEHMQMQQSNVVNGVISQPVPQYTSLLNKKENITNSPSTSQTVSPQRIMTAVLPKTPTSTMQYQTATNDVSLVEAVNVTGNSAVLPSINGNNSTILSLLASSSAQSPSSSSSPSSTNINLSNLLTSTPNARNMNTNHTVNVAGQRVVAKRLKMQNGGRMIPANQSPTQSSIANATVIAAAAANVSSVASNINAQPVIRLSLSSLTNQATPVIQPRTMKNIAGRVITPGNIKTASLMNNIQPVNVTSTGNIQISNNMHNLSAVQSLLNSNVQTANAIRLKTNNRRNVSVAGLQSLAVNNVNNQTVGETQTMNCAKMQAIGTTQANANTSTHLSTAELQTLAGTLTAAPTIGTIQLARNVQALPSGSVHLVSNTNASQNIGAMNKATSLNSIQLNATSDSIVAGKAQKIMRLASNPEATAQTSVGLPVSALSALLSGTPITDSTISNPAKGLSLVERIGSTATAVSQPASASATNATIVTNPTNANVGVQNVQVSIPGMAVPITLSLNVGDQGTNSYLDALSQNAHAVTTLSNVVGTSVIFANSNAGGGIKTSALRPVTNATTVTNVQAGTVQQLQLIGSVQRNKLGTPVQKQMAARSLLNANRVRLAVSPNAVVQQQSGGQGQVLSVTAQQQLQLALQKQAHQLQLHQGLTAAGGLKVAQKRRRSSVATDGS